MKYSIQSFSVKLSFTFFLFVSSIISQNITDLSIAEQIAYSTIRIEILTKDNSYGQGTGFIFSFLEDGNQSVPAIVTNKHVLAEAKFIRFFLSQKGEDGLPIKDSLIPIILYDLDSLIMLHPDKEVDLAILFLAPVLQEADKQGYRPFYKTLTKSLIPSEDELKQLDAVEDIIMVGYPIGIWDTVNNYPIFRRGITATHPFNKYLGKEQFVIDAACYPGSSGSPIFILNPGMFVTKFGKIVAGRDRIYLLGILYGGPTLTTEGQLKVVEIPKNYKLKAEVEIPINLGLVIRSSKLLEFESLIKASLE